MKTEVVKNRVVNYLTKYNQRTVKEAEDLFEENYKFFSNYPPKKIAEAIESV